MTAAASACGSCIHECLKCYSPEFSKVMKRHILILAVIWLLIANSVAIVYCVSWKTVVYERFSTLIVLLESLDIRLDLGQQWVIEGWGHETSFLLDFIVLIACSNIIIALVYLYFVNKGLRDAKQVK